MERLGLALSGVGIAMLIVLGCDDRYALSLAVTVYSALVRVSGDQQLRVLILDAGISGPSRRRIQRVIDKARVGTDVQWVEPEMEQFASMRTTHWGSPASYLPLLIPSLVNGDGLVLYLDSDLLVLSDLTELWRQGIENPRDQVHAVLDYGLPSLGEALKNDACARLGIDPHAPYFNSGVMLINLDAWRANDIAERAIQFAIDNPQIMRFTDQDALNAVIQGEWRQLDPQWNVLAGSVERLVNRANGTKREKRQMRTDLVDSSHILHFAGPRKPWRPGYRRTGKSEYRAELRDCGWFDSPSEYRLWRTRVALLSPVFKARRGVLRLSWPFVKWVRSKTRGKAMGRAM